MISDLCSPIKHSLNTTKRQSEAFKFSLCGPFQKKMPHGKTTDVNICFGTVNADKYQQLDPSLLGDYLKNPSPPCQEKDGKVESDPF